eukprot:363236-Rhodomonas_salina.1
MASSRSTVSTGTSESWKRTPGQAGRRVLDSSRSSLPCRTWSTERAAARSTVGTPRVPLELSISHSLPGLSDLLSQQASETAPSLARAAEPAVVDQCPHDVAVLAAPVKENTVSALAAATGHKILVAHVLDIFLHVSDGMLQPPTQHSTKRNLDLPKVQFGAPSASARHPLHRCRFWKGGSLRVQELCECALLSAGQVYSTVEVRHQSGRDVRVGQAGGRTVSENCPFKRLSDST